MPSETSVYKKIYIVLSTAQSVPVSSIGDLREKIDARKSPTFETRQYDPRRDTFVRKQSERSIRKTVHLCRDLGLLEEDGHLSRAGRHALEAGRFDRVIVRQVRVFCEARGVRLEELNDLIKESLHADPPVLPTSRELCNATGTKIRQAAFSRMLTLLAQCGGAESSQRKVYLRIL